MDDAIREGDLVEWRARSGSRSTGIVKFMMDGKARIQIPGRDKNARLNISLDKLTKVHK